MAAATPCPLCSVPLEGYAKILYGHRVCGKCHQDFALRRAFAFFLDNMIIQLVVFLLTIIILIGAAMMGAAATAASGGNNEFGGNFALLVFFLMMLVLFFFAIGKDGFSGHSAAKYMLGLQVIDAHTGRPGNFWDSFLRKLSLGIPFMPLYVLYQLLSADGGRMGDGWAGTKVIWKKYRDQEPFLSHRERQNRIRARITAGLGASSEAKSAASP